MLSRLQASTEVVPQMVTLFISHASEDKDNFVHPLAEALIGAGFDVWFDEYELTMGDSLHDKIGDGLKKADYGVVILSQSFFAKDWTRRELDGLFALERENRKLILPVWLGVTKDEVAQFSPILAGQLGGKGDRGVGHIVEEIQRAISVSNRTRDVAGGSSRTALQALAKKLASREQEKARLDSPAGADEVTEAALQIVEEIVQAVQLANQVEKKRFSVSRRQADSLSVSGPMSVLLQTALRDIFVNTGARAEFYVRFGQGSRIAPHPSNIKTLEEMIFVPRIVDDTGVKWLERDGEGVVMTAQEASGRIIEKYAHHVNELTNG